jgi:hypothetical protein
MKPNTEVVLLLTCHQRHLLFSRGEEVGDSSRHHVLGVALTLYPRLVSFFHTISDRFLLLYFARSVKFACGLKLRSLFLFALFTILWLLYEYK